METVNPGVQPAPRLLEEFPIKALSCCYHLELAASCSSVATTLCDTGQALGIGSSKLRPGVLVFLCRDAWLAGASPTPYPWGDLRPVPVDMQAPVTFIASEGRVGKDLPSCENASSAFPALKCSSFLVLEEAHEKILTRGMAWVYLPHCL